MKLKTNKYYAPLCVAIPILITSTTNDARPISLCKKNESIIFSCILDDKKYISICSTNAQNFSDIIYRKSNLQKHTIEIKGNYKDKYNPFFMNHYFRELTDYYSLNFSKNDIDFELIKLHDESAKNYTGIYFNSSNRKNGNIINNNACKYVYYDKLDSLFGKLQCNPESSTGCK